MGCRFGMDKYEAGREKSQYTHYKKLDYTRLHCRFTVFIKIKNILNDCSAPPAQVGDTVQQESKFTDGVTMAQDLYKHLINVLSCRRSQTEHRRSLYTQSSQSVIVNPKVKLKHKLCDVHK